MFSYQSVNGADIVSLEDSEEMGISEKWFFTQNWCFFLEYLKFSLIKTMIYPKHILANSTISRVKDTQIWPEKEANPLRG